MAAVENIIPPVPADTAIALGAFLTQGGSVTVLGVYAATLVANTGSAALMYWLARTRGRDFIRGPLGRRLVRPAALARIEGLYERHGTWGIFLSRFIPGVRAVVPPFAGIAGLGAWRALVPTVTASAIWYAALIWAAAEFIQRVDDVPALVGGINRWALIVGGVVVVGAVFWIVRRR